MISSEQAFQKALELERASAANLTEAELEARRWDAVQVGNRAAAELKSAQARLAYFAEVVGRLEREFQEAERWAFVYCRALSIKRGLGDPEDRVRQWTERASPEVGT